MKTNPTYAQQCVGDIKSRIEQDKLRDELFRKQQHLMDSINSMRRELRAVRKRIRQSA